MMSWVHINTKQSMLAAMLMLLFSNFTAQLVDPVSSNVVLIRRLMILAIGLKIAIYINDEKKRGI